MLELYIEFEFHRVSNCPVRAGIKLNFCSSISRFDSSNTSFSGFFELEFSRVGILKVKTRRVFEFRVVRSGTTIYIISTSLPAQTLFLQFVDRETAYFHHHSGSKILYDSTSRRTDALKHLWGPESQLHTDLDTCSSLYQNHSKTKQIQKNYF